MAIKIYIDQGHNPENPNAGAAGNGYREQDITFRVGEELFMLLSEDPRFEARLSRPTPTTQLGNSNVSSLRLRVEDATSWGADYFISIHTNASDSPSAKGVEVLVYSIDSRAGDLAKDILEELSEASGFPSRGVKERPGLYVLRKTPMPAVLAELGFITNPTEANLMANNPSLFANAIYRGIVKYTD